MVRKYSRIIRGVCALCAVLFWTGCSVGENEEVSERGNGFLENEGVTISAEAGSDGDKTADNGPAEELTPEEVKQFTDFVNRTENNGFLLSQYDQVSGADLNEIFYNGAGMESGDLSEEERKAYETAGYSIETDITRLTTGQIEEFLQRKAGVGLKDMTGELDWVYLKDTDCYVSQHGDTNYCAFVCTGGTRRGETCEIRLKAGDDYISDCIVTLKKNGDDYRFISNRYFENTDDTDLVRKIEDQSFPLEIEGWGEVEFVSLAPDILENASQDVTFRLEKAGAEVFVFPEVRDENLRVNDRFEQIEAVAFPDYDEDGYTDIVIICTYEQIEGENAGTRHPEVRIYKGGEQTFRYMGQLCFRLNTEGKNQSISQVMGEIREEAPDLSGLDADTLRQLEVFAEAKEQWIPEDYEPFIFGYTVHDLDGDGSLELMVQVMAGTGLFSENHFYRMNDSRDGIEELPQEYYYGSSELDIGVSGEGTQAFRDADGTVYYMASDNTRNGYAENSRNDGAYFLKEGRVHSVVYRGLYREAQGEDSWKETYYDAADNEISSREWEALLEEFRAGKEEVPCNISWINAYPEDVEKASVQEVLGRLSECLQ